MAAGAALAAKTAVASDEWQVARKTGRSRRAQQCCAPTRRTGWAALLTDGGVGVVDGREELAGGEGVEGAETGVELGRGDAALAVEPAEEMGGRAFSFERIAFEAGGNQVAIGVAPRLCTGHDVVEALDARVGAAQTIKTVAAFAEVDGLAQGAGLEEVEVFQVGGLRRAGGAADGDGARHGGQALPGGQAGAKAANLIGQADVNNVAGFAATDEVERTEDDEAADRFTHGAGADANAAGEPGHGEAELELAFETAVADEMRIDGAVGDGQTQAREEKVLELFPKMFDIQFFCVSWRILRWSW